MTRSSVPGRDEAAEYYFTYIDQVPAGDVLATLARQSGEMVTLLTNISDEQSRHRYGPDKWTIRQVVSHINDTERVFAYRALWFARALPLELPSFDQDVAVTFAGADDRDWNTHIDEFAAVRSASVALFRSLSDEAWNRRGVASGNPFTVRALAYITAGHVAHHVRILHERYL